MSFWHVVAGMQSLDPDLEAELGRIKDTAPKYGIWTKIKVHVHTCLKRENAKFNVP